MQKYVSYLVVSYQNYSLTFEKLTIPLLTDIVFQKIS